MPRRRASTRELRFAWGGCSCAAACATVLMGQHLAHERGEGARGNRDVPPHLGRGFAGETWFPPRERAEGERRSCLGGRLGRLRLLGRDDDVLDRQAERLD